MKLNYYKYSPIILEQEDYEKGKITNESSKKKIKYAYIISNLFSLRKHKKRFIIPTETFETIDFIAYEQNGNLYDLITGQQLIKSPGDDKEFESDKIYYMDCVKLVSAIDILQKVKQLPQRVLRDYRVFMNEEIKTKTKEVFLRKEAEKKHSLELWNQIMEYESFVKTKKY